MADKESPIFKHFRRERTLYLMMIPGILFYILFRYGPMAGLIMAFQNYMPALGFLRSKWVGLAHFARFFGSPNFGMLFRNTLILGTLNIVLFFPLPIILALMLNEAKHVFFKRTCQTLLYIPHFFSWVVIYSITYMFLTVDGGVINNVIKYSGMEPVSFLTLEETFRPIVMIQIIWKESGWGTIIFLATLVSIDQELYAAALVDGANRRQSLWHITLPSLKPTIITMLILRLGHFLDLGFEQLLLNINALNREVGEVFDTYVYTTGILNGQFSYTTAVGMFKSIVALFLVIGANKIAKKAGEEGIY
jgi:putative aldouronate transport system permease protein